MAELLGAVASGISVLQLAGQVTKSVIKLKDYWDQVKEAPAEIAYLLREIESLNVILGHINDDQSQQNTSGVSVGNVCVQQSLNLCKEGADELGGLVQELAQKIEGKGRWRGKVASAKVVLKKEEVKKLKRRMKNAILLLSLAYQFHTNAMMQLQPDIIATRVATHMSSLTVTTVSNELYIKQDVIKSDSGSVVTRQYNSWTNSPSWTRYLLGHIEYGKQTTRYKRKERQEFVAKYVGPSWTLNQKVFQILGYNTLSGRQITLKTYRIVPQDSPIFVAVRKGDLRGVQMLLAEREAFVTDRIELMEETLLHIAVKYRNREMCQMLILAGADPLVINRHGWTPLHSLSSDRRIGKEVYNVDSGVRISQLLLTAGADDALIGQHDVLEVFVGPLALFQALQRELFPPHIAMTARARFDTGSRIMKMYHIRNVSYVIRHIVSNGDQIDWAVVSLSDNEGETFLHDIAGAIPYASGSSLSIYHISAKQAMLEDIGNGLEDQIDAMFMWRKLLRDILGAGVKDMISNISNTGFSPFCNLLSTVARYRPEGLSTVVSNWLHDLRSSGVDLIVYGAQERGYILQFPSFYEYCGPYLAGIDDRYRRKWYHDNECPWTTRLITISYGPEPEDWIFWFDEWTDQFAGIFWACIEDHESGLNLNEHEELHVPGAWDVHE